MRIYPRQFIVMLSSNNMRQRRFKGSNNKNDKISKINETPLQKLNKPIKIIIIIVILIFIIMAILGNNYYENRYLISQNNKVLNVGVAILITKDPGISGGFLDSAVALAFALNDTKSKYDISLIAMMKYDNFTCIPVLKYFGYNIITSELPITIDDIQNKQYANELLTDGCCGMDELLKLEAYKWSSYDYVLFMDADMHIHQNFDEIFDEMSSNSKYTLGWTHGATADKGYELLNGGFLLIKPNMEDYNKMYEYIIEGDFRGGKGWKGSGIGWCYGGRTLQGILPFYYFKIKPNNHLELKRCKYNNMVEIDKCRKWEYNDVAINHFTWYINMLPINT